MCAYRLLHLVTKCYSSTTVAYFLIMYGKHFASLYRGSMYGAGAITFAVWGYVIGNMKPDRVHGFVVEMNPRELSNVIGEERSAIEGAIQKLCDPDPGSRNKEKEGRRLVKVAEYSYQVVSGVHYAEMRDEEARRAYNRERMGRYRAKRLINQQPLEGEQEYLRAVEAGATQEELEAIEAKYAVESA